MQSSVSLDRIDLKILSILQEDGRVSNLKLAESVALSPTAVLARVQRLSRRVHMLSGRPAIAGYAGRLAMKGRHAAELTHALARIGRAQLAMRDRRVQQLRRQLETFDLGRRLAGVRTRLVSGRGQLERAMTARHHRAESQFRSCATRLDAMSPLAVLGRGYAVAWNADRTHVLRDAAEVKQGDTVRVTLSRGEIEAKVSRTE